MCRVAGWVGPALPLAALTHGPPHALLVQSWAPREMREARLNADGVGAAWYPDDGDPRPVRYRSVQPIWSDENLASLAPRTRSHALLAVVRSATPGLEVCGANTPPFVHGRLAFAHNGYLSEFRQRFMRPMRDRLSDAAYELVVGATDSEHVFALFAQELGDSRSPDRMAEALERTLRTCAAIARERGGRAVLNLVATDGDTLVASRFSCDGPSASLHVATAAEGYRGGFVVASEPLTEDPAWQPVPESTLVVATRDGHAGQRSLA